MSKHTDRLAKLLPLLGSDREGEVVAAAHAIGRLLQGAGKDWHDLAKAAGSLFMPGVTGNLTAAMEAAFRDAFGDWEKEAEQHRQAAREREQEAARRAWREHQDGMARRREEARQRRAAMTPEEKEVRRRERAAEREAREERAACAQAERERLAALHMSETDRQRLKASITWCLDHWQGPKDQDWHVLADAAQAAKVGAWAKVNAARVEMIRRKVAGEPEPDVRPKRRRTKAA